MLRPNLDLDPDWDFWPDPDLDSMNTDPKHWQPRCAGAQQSAKLLELERENTFLF